MQRNRFGIGTFKTPILCKGTRRFRRSIPAPIAWRAAGKSAKRFRLISSPGEIVAWGGSARRRIALARVRIEQDFGSRGIPERRGVSPRYFCSERERGPAVRSAKHWAG